MIEAESGFHPNKWELNTSCREQLQLGLESVAHKFGLSLLVFYYLINCREVELGFSCKEGSYLAYISKSEGLVYTLIVLYLSSYISRVLFSFRNRKYVIATCYRV